MSASAAPGMRLHPGINLGHRHPDAHEEAEEVVFGFWVFLMSDAVLFACLFATFATMIGSTAGAPGPKTLFDMKSAAMETGALLLSSFTFGMAAIAMKYRHSVGLLLMWLGITLGLGLVFLGLELKDFLEMVEKGGGPDASGFTSSVFALVGTHGLHVTSGSIWIVTMMVQILVFGVSDDVKLRLLRLALFWHFLDIVWVGIFSVVYLQGLV